MNRSEHLTPNQLRADLRLNVEDFFLAVYDFGRALPKAYRFGRGPLLFAPPSDEHRRKLAAFASRNSAERRASHVRNRSELLSLTQFSGRYCLSLNQIIELAWAHQLPVCTLVYGRAYFRRDLLPEWEARWEEKSASRVRVEKFLAEKGITDVDVWYAEREAAQ